MPGLITYKIVDDLNDKLKKSARIVCNFWNFYITPEKNVVVRLGTFTKVGSGIIARAWTPYVGDDGTVYGEIEFNTEYLADYDIYKTTGTVVHEVGHTLGFGFAKWMEMFSKETGKFKDQCTDALPALKDMAVERGGGDGTRYSHWDEKIYGDELMTGYSDRNEHVLPVTIDIMGFFGHHVDERLTKQTNLKQLLVKLEKVAFARQTDAETINREHHVRTDILEEIYETKD